jgi:hypothetical protein
MMTFQSSRQTELRQARDRMLRKLRNNLNVQLKQGSQTPLRLPGMTELEALFDCTEVEIRSVFEELQGQGYTLLHRETEDVYLLYDPLTMAVLPPE